ncbi:MAG TPA: cytochrome b/b6 domain-containing protein [Vitreimonas sp.]|uniref:cytochrome b/b6 domain-containing protein n=1 Tax=Vitreimonas sp. TaxID=3069702 RepID=UPI002D748993|nr:cytochrome b/b6 domain-containing protein [Vitreimonas sp.]HYD87043.1 cytochrome b/b6 domain-containing protein [Vitreimonas sp.]
MRLHKDVPAPGGKVSVYRHTTTVRVTHWLNVICVLFLVLSGINILAAHPALYWGSQSTFGDPWLRFDLTHWPKWPPVRDLATARNYHFFFAWVFVINGVIYLAVGFLRRHFARELTPTKAELRSLPQVAKEHARFHFPHVRRYNPIQQLSYLAVIFVLLPLMLMTGLTMSPAFNAIAPWMLDLFGGRQSARTIHFISAALIVLFIFVHVALVILAGFWNNLRSMITGRYVVDPEAPSSFAKATEDKTNPAGERS